MSQPKSNEDYIKEFHKQFTVPRDNDKMNSYTVLNELITPASVEAWLYTILAQKDAEVAEKIICSAVRFNDKVWMGHRHMFALDAMHGELSYTMTRKEMNEQQTDRDQGFVTSTGRYVGREEAWNIAKKAGQIINRDNQKSGYLFSEDLW